MSAVSLESKGKLIFQGFIMNSEISNHPIFTLISTTLKGSKYHCLLSSSRQIHYSGDSRSSSCPALTSSLREFPLMPCPRRWSFPLEFCSLSLSSCAHSFHFFPHRYCSSAVISLSSSLFLPSDSPLLTPCY